MHRFAISFREKTRCYTRTQTHAIALSLFLSLLVMLQFVKFTDILFSRMEFCLSHVLSDIPGRPPSQTSFIVNAALCKVTEKDFANSISRRRRLLSLFLSLPHSLTHSLSLCLSYFLALSFLVFPLTLLPAEASLSFAKRMYVHRTSVRAE